MHLDRNGQSIKSCSLGNSNGDHLSQIQKISWPLYGQTIGMRSMNFVRGPFYQKKMVRPSRKLFNWKRCFFWLGERLAYDIVALWLFTLRFFILGLWTHSNRCVDAKPWSLTLLAVAGHGCYRSSPKKSVPQRGTLSVEHDVTTAMTSSETGN